MTEHGAGTGRVGRWRRIAAVGLSVVVGTSAAGADGWQFTDVTAAAGLTGLRYAVPNSAVNVVVMGGGAAAGDLDCDGDHDLVVLRGELAAPAVLLHQGDGTFAPGTPLTGVPRDDQSGVAPNGAVLADLDGDGDLDLVVGGFVVESNAGGPRLLLNDGFGGFDDATPAAWLAMTRDTWSPSCGDADGDGDLDVFLAHWTMGVAPGGGEHLWENQGGGALVDVGAAAGVDDAFDDDGVGDHTFTATFVDLDHDGAQDLLVAADFGNSRVFRNLGNGSYEDVTDAAVITDENGMGSAVGDVDGDLDLDWFVSSVRDANGKQDPDGNWGVTGNRLYLNACGPDAAGVCTAPLAFVDGTEASGVRDGWWGWGSCFADLDLDGDLDLFQVNGFPMGDPEFDTDPPRLFVNGGAGVFTEQWAALGVDDTLHGRAVVCFDYDGDGDIDLFVGNWDAPARLYRNELDEPRHWLRVRLAGSDANTWGVGARVYATAAGTTQLRPILAGSNFLSSNPIEAHFGLGEATVVDLLRVVWPDGHESRAHGVAVDTAVVVVAGLLLSDTFESGDTAAWVQGPP